MHIVVQTNEINDDVEERNLQECQPSAHFLAYGTTVRASATVDLCWFGAHMIIMGSAPDALPHNL